MQCSRYFEDYPNVCVSLVPSKILVFSANITELFTEPDNTIQIKTTFIQMKDTFIQKEKTVNQNKKKDFICWANSFIQHKNTFIQNKTLSNV